MEEDRQRQEAKDKVFVEAIGRAFASGDWTLDEGLLQDVISMGEMDSFFAKTLSSLKAAASGVEVDVNVFQEMKNAIKKNSVKLMKITAIMEALEKAYVSCDWNLDEGLLQDIRSVGEFNENLLDTLVVLMDKKVDTSGFNKMSIHLKTNLVIS